MSALILTRSVTLISLCSMMRKYAMCLTHESQKRHSFDRSTYGPNKSTLHSAKYCVSDADKRSFESRHGMPPTWVFVMSTSRSDRTRTLLGDVGIESTSCEHKPQPNNEDIVCATGVHGMLHRVLCGSMECYTARFTVSYTPRACGKARQGVITPR